MPSVLSPYRAPGVLTDNVGFNARRVTLGGCVDNTVFMELGVNSGTGAVVLDIGQAANEVNLGDVAPAGEIVLGPKHAGNISFFGVPSTAMPGKITVMTPSDLTGMDNVSQANFEADIDNLHDNIHSIVTALHDLGLIG